MSATENTEIAMNVLEIVTLGLGAYVLFVIIPYWLVQMLKDKRPVSRRPEGPQRHWIRGAPGVVIDAQIEPTDDPAIGIATVIKTYDQSPSDPPVGARIPVRHADVYVS